MKTLLSLLSVVVLTLSANLFTGCGSTPVQKAIKSEGVLIVSVDSGMQIWASYVRQHQSDGKVTQSQVDTVKTAYNAYYDAQQVAKAIIEKIITNGTTNPADIATANAAVINAENQLLALLNQYIK